MFTRLKESLLEAARGPHALRTLAGVSFIESSLFPIPPDVMLIPMVLANRKRAFVIAGVCTLASVLGGLAGYAIGYYGFELIGRPLLSFFYGPDRVDDGLNWAYDTRERLGLLGQFLAISGGGLTPFPYKLITIVSGTTQVGLPVFIAASVFSRGLRFFLEATLLYFVGERAHGVIERRFGLIMTAFFLLLVGGVAALTFLH